MKLQCVILELQPCVFLVSRLDPELPGLKVIALTDDLYWSKLFVMGLPADTVRSQIREAKKQLVQRLREQWIANQQISDLRELIRANANFLPTEERDSELLFLDIFRFPVNVTEAVRLAIFVATVYNKRLTPVEIRNVAETLSFDFSEYSNPMASIHTILKRMKESEPPTVDYDEESDTYWFGEGALASAVDLVEPKFIEELSIEVVTRVLTRGEDMPTAVSKAAASKIAKKVEAIHKGRE